MKLLLINPYFEGIKPDAPQLGLVFLGTYIQEHTDCEVQVIDPIPQGLSEDDVLSLAKKVDIVGLTCFTEIRFQCFDFAKRVKEENKDCKLVLGGVHATALDVSILEHYPFIDAIIRGEGEGTLLEIVNDKPYDEIAGITWRKNEKVIRNPNRPPIKNIDDLHFDYSLLPPIYVENWRDEEVPFELKKLKHLPIIASRGCPYNCSFCASHPYWGGMWRSLSPNELVHRLEDAVDKYRANYFRFYDALFPLKRKWVTDFCQLLKERNLDISFRIDIRSGSNREALEQLRKVGCSVVGMGVESGSDRILKRINKRTTRREIINTVNICEELGYWVIGYFMLGLPDETREDIKKTIELIKYFDYHNYTRFQIYPNTSFYDELKQVGEINDEIWFDKSKDVPIEVKGGEDYFAEIRATSYCKENFKSATFYQHELDWPIRYSFYYHNIHNPNAVIRKYGLLKGSLSLVKAIMDLPLKGRLHKMHHKLKDWLC